MTEIPNIHFAGDNSIQKDCTELQLVSIQVTETMLGLLYPGEWHMYPFDSSTHALLPSHSLNLVNYPPNEACISNNHLEKSKTSLIAKIRIALLEMVFNAVRIKVTFSTRYLGAADFQPKFLSYVSHICMPPALNKKGFWYVNKKEPTCMNTMMLTQSTEKKLFPEHMQSVK